MTQPASKRLVTEADISDPTSAAGSALATSIEEATKSLATRTLVAQENPFVLTRNTSGNPAPRIIGTDPDRLFYVGLSGGNLGYGWESSPGVLAFSGGTELPSGVSWTLCYQVVTFGGHHYLLAQSDAANASDHHMSIYRTPVLSIGADSGWVWTKVHDLSADANGNGIATQMCVNDDYLFVCSYADPVGGPKVWRSANGTTWSVILSDPSIRHHHAIEADIFNPGHLWLTSGDGVGVSVRRSTDNGTTWETITASAGFQAVQISFHEDFVAFASDNGAMTWQAWMRDTEEMVVGSPNWHYNISIPRGTRTVAGNDYTPGDNDHYSLLAFYGCVDPQTGVYYADANEANAGDWNGIFAARIGQPLTLLHRGMTYGSELNNRVFIWKRWVFCGLWHFPRLDAA